MSNLGEFLLSIAVGVERGLRYDLARQVQDEARHFVMLSERAAEIGTPVGSHPAELIIWDRFRLGRSLAERLMIEQRIGETSGLDGGAVLHSRLEAAGDMVTARLLDFINADEVTHVQTANRWLSDLLGGHETVDELEARTRDWVSANAMSLPGPLPAHRDFRLLAGY